MLSFELPQDAYLETHSLPNPNCTTKGKKKQRPNILYNECFREPNLHLPYKVLSLHEFSFFFAPYGITYLHGLRHHGHLWLNNMIIQCKIYISPQSLVLINHKNPKAPQDGARPVHPPVERLSFDSFFASRTSLLSFLSIPFLCRSFLTCVSSPRFRMVCPQSGCCTTFELLLPLFHWYFKGSTSRLYWYFKSANRTVEHPY